MFSLFNSYCSLAMRVDIARCQDSVSAVFKNVVVAQPQVIFLLWQLMIGATVHVPMA